MDTSDPPAQGRDGLYNMLVQILSLLNPGSWLPAVFGLGGLTLLLEFREMRDVDLPRALRTVLDAVVSLSQSAVAAALVVLPTLAIAALITQSFSHVATRFLQGHWAPRPGAAGPEPAARPAADRPEAQGRGPAQGAGAGDPGA